MKALLEYLVLPSELSDFERSYLARMNRIGLWFFMAHLPVFVAIGYFNGMGLASPFLLTVLVLAGPVVAQRAFANPRLVSLVYGFTAMILGGLLVHFGQGPVQIEMHFYFFAMLAMLALYANPMVIVVAAVTVAVHHFGLWLYLPKSIFNYEAPVWVVLVHATFVVVESVASCFISRNFFDNVIGLDKIVQARTQALDARNTDMRLVLDNVEQGFLTISRDGVLSSERSAIVDVWLGKLEAGTKFCDYLTKSEPDAGIRFELGWDEVIEDIMPLEVCIDQLPNAFTLGLQHFSLSYRPIMDGEQLDKCLIVITDITTLVEHERSEKEQIETLRIFDKVLSDKSGFLEFFQESDSLLEKIRELHASFEAERFGADGSEIDGSEINSGFTLLKRQLHTLKGNSAIFGVQTIADICHELESQLIEEDKLFSSADLERLVERWTGIGENLKGLMGDRTSNTIELEDEEFESILKAVLAREEYESIAQRIAAWKYEPTKKRLGRIASQAQGIAARLNKGEITVDIQDGALRIDPGNWSGFWSSFVHVVRNAVDHGLETEEQRTSTGKSPAGTLALKTFLDQEEFVISISDDGRGVNWKAVSSKAKLLGYAAETEEDLKVALFCDGLSTAASVSDVSGRGVGMAAARMACEELGGRILLDSTPGHGTNIEFRFPQEAMGSQPKLGRC